MDKDKVRAQLHEILDIVLDCNGLEQRKTDVTGNKPTMFMYVFGHTAKVSVDLHETGWEPDSRADKQWDFYFDRDIDVLKLDEMFRETEKASVAAETNS